MLPVGASRTRGVPPPLPAPRAEWLSPLSSSGAMGSAFEGVIKSVIRELDHRGKLIPVDSLRSSTSFQPYCLLARKLSRLWFWKPRYKCINLSIRDILEPNDPEPGTQPGGKGVSWPACCPRWALGFLPSRPSAQVGWVAGGRTGASALVWL